MNLYTNFQPVKEFLREMAVGSPCFEENKSTPLFDHIRQSGELEMHQRRKDPMIDDDIIEDESE